MGKTVWVDGKERELRQRHCVIELTSTGRTKREVRIPSLRSPWTQSITEAWAFMEWLVEHNEVSAGFEVVSENFVPIPARLINGQLEPKYRDWIETNVLDTADGLCLEWSGLMCQVFPELQLVSGKVVVGGHSLLNNSIYTEGAPLRQPHYWCVDTKGIIVDPTAHQFEAGGHYQFEYKPVPVGFCSICGAIIYESGRCSVYCYGAEEGEVWSEGDQKPVSHNWSFSRHRCCKSSGATCSDHKGCCNNTCG